MAAVVSAVALVAVSVLTIMLLDIDTLAEPIKAQVQIAALLHRQTTAAATVLDLKAAQAAELNAQALGFGAGQFAASDTLVNASVETDLTLVDRLPRGGLSGQGSGRNDGQGGEREQEALHGENLSKQVTAGDRDLMGS